MRQIAVLIACLVAMLGCDESEAQLLSGGAIAGGHVGTDAELSVVLVLVDDWGLDRDPNRGATGAWIPASTPGLDRLASEGKTFTYAYATPRCQPTRASLLQLAFQASDDGGTGMLGNASTLDYTRDSNLPALLQAAAAHSEVYEKRHLFEVGGGGVGDYAAASIGFDYFALSHSTTGLYWDDTYDAATYAEYVAAGPGYTTPPSTHDAAVAQVSNFFFGHMLARFAARDRTTRSLWAYLPWLVHIPMHDPYTPGSSSPGDCPGSTEDECEELMLQKLDDQIDMLLESVEASPTVVIVMGDNGSTNTPTGGKGTTYETGLRVPLYVWGRGVTSGTITDQVHAADVGATIADLLGITSYAGSDAIDGYSFAAQLGTHSCAFSGRCWSDRASDRGIVMSDDSGSPGPYRAYVQRDVAGYQLGRSRVGSPDPEVYLYDVSGYDGASGNPADLCGDDGVCTAAELDAAAETAYAALCAGLDAADSAGGAACPAL